MFTTIIVQPLLNLLVLLYDVLGHDLGVAIIMLTVIIRVVLYPLAQSALRSQVAMQEIQPKLKALQAQHKGDREGLARATMALYRENKVNPLSSCLPVLIQLPFLIGIYWALQRVVEGQSLNLLYPFVPHPGAMNTVAFGILPLGKPSILLAVLAGGAQWWQTRMLTATRPPPAVAKGPGKDEDMMAMVNKQMAFTMPIMTVVIGIGLPAGLTLYWFVTTALQVLQQWWLLQARAKQQPSSSRSAT
ncbi:membrane protein insertase YidC [Candidatus Uhrbacteria bacterium]|nr:membrane protein insertase YidC [Candidatus Uhrbacteria bacterium]